MEELLLQEDVSIAQYPPKNVSNLEIIMDEDIQVSLFENVKANKPINTVNLFDWLEDPMHQKNIAYLRNQPTEEDRKRVKGMLRCITASGTFSIRKLDGLIQHSGIICIDIDGKENLHIEDFPNLRDQISNISNVAYCSLSASGNGVYCLIPIMYPENHKEHFNALKEDFLAYNIVIDISCSDVSRLRICSHDENAYTNKEAIVYIKRLNLYGPKKPAEPSRKSSAYPKCIIRHSSTVEKVTEIIKRIEKKHIDITESYAQWFEIGCALADEFGEEGRDFFHSISQYHPMYSEMRTDTLFSSCLGGGYSFSIGTFFHWAEKYNLT
ncbi:MAG: hypothetical protein EOO43_00370 [Flavobacterium sp.]|nr:MAG: hypothetical protein EOO43_00370 [Flavobacterium sp.]